ncbi:MAG: sugar transferase, partial [Rhodobacteraceae bacterium]|nr:sugar transferase [Paracoccaceae bacterium]
MERHQVRPGITGLAQVNGFRGETTDAFSAKMRLEYDLQYLESQSLLLDFKVIAQTIAREFFSGNGY